MSWRAWLWWKPPCLLRRVLINMRHSNDQALRGVLWQSRGAWLVLRDAEALRAGSQPAPIDGEIVVHRDNVAFVQVLP